MRSINIFISLVLLAAVTACGGGGGSPGTPSGGSPNKSELLILTSLIDINNNPTTSISASGFTVLRAQLTDANGAAVINQVLEVSGDESKVVFPDGTTALTDNNGFAVWKVARSSLLATGAGNLTVKYDFKVGSVPAGNLIPTADKIYSITVGYQLTASNINLSTLDVGTFPLDAYGTRPISVVANINGVAATGAPVLINFSVNCGVITPNANTDSFGVARASYTAANNSVPNDQGCSGSTVSVTASTVGANSVSGNISVKVAPATNLIFVDAKPSTIYLVGSGGNTQSIVRFKVVNSTNAAIQGEAVTLELKDLAVGSPKVSFGTVGNVSALNLTTDANGFVSVAVFSGTFPTSATVKASLASNPNISQTSSVLAVASGRSAQKGTSLAVKSLSIEGLNNDSVETQLTMSLSDRVGNPVIDGTAVNFVSESGGLVSPSSCVTLNSQCTTTFRSQGSRPADGRVSVLAYAVGEEDFTDLNGDNVYTLGEPFIDSGNAFLQNSALVGGIDGAWIPGYFTVPRAGSIACKQYLVNGVPLSLSQDSSFLGKPSTCDGMWGLTDVRQQAVIVLASGNANVTGAFGFPVAGVRTDISVGVRDINGNSMPTGSTVVVTGVDRTPTNGFTCSTVGSNNFVVPSLLGPSVFSVSLSGCLAGDAVLARVTSPLGIVTSSNFPLPTEPLTAVPSGNATLNVGNTRSYKISGGFAPYSASSADISKVSASIAADQLNITGVAITATPVNVTVQDANGSSLTIAVTVQ